MALLLCAATVVPTTVAAGRLTLAVVVHPSRTDRLDLEELARIYLRTRRFWRDGTPIVPLNREVDTPEREAFTVRVLGDRVRHLTTYWNEQYFHGVFPPDVASSSASVRRHVATDRGSVGYLDVSEVDDSVRVVLTLGEP